MNIAEKPIEEQKATYEAELTSLIHQKSLLTVDETELKTQIGKLVREKTTLAIKIALLQGKLRTIRYQIANQAQRKRLKQDD